MKVDEKPKITEGAVKISVSMVTYYSSMRLLGRTLDGLERSLQYSRAQDAKVELQLFVVDNSTDPECQESLSNFIFGEIEGKFDRVELWHPGENIGYGAAHNQALEHADSDFHLVLNPDVELDEDALYNGMAYLHNKPDVAMVSPRATHASGQAQFLCKRYPSVLVLFLRAFAPLMVREWFRGYMHSYEIRDNCSSDSVADVPLVSGCCMYARTSALRQVAGFSDNFFMYFEDFDLSLRLLPVGRLVYLPSMHIMHYGGYSARKGMRHILMFGYSGLKFFHRYGWCWV